MLIDIALLHFTGHVKTYSTRKGFGFLTSDMLQGVIGDVTLTLDRFIVELMDCKPLTEQEVESLCEKVTSSAARTPPPLPLARLVLCARLVPKLLRPLVGRRARC